MDRGGNFEGFQDVLVDKFDWDALTASSIWAFGPHSKGTNILVDYSVPFDTDKEKLDSIRASITQGF